MFEPLVTEELLARLRDSFPDGIMRLANCSHDSIQQQIGEQRVLHVIQAWFDEQQQLTPSPLMGDRVFKRGG